jgi:hypothetical protein
MNIRFPVIFYCFPPARVLFGTKPKASFDNTHSVGYEGPLDSWFRMQAVAGEQNFRAGTMRNSVLKVLVHESKTSFERKYIIKNKNLLASKKLVQTPVHN